MNDWPTEEQDIVLAEKLINKYIDLNDGQNIEIYEVIVEDRLEFISNNPEWVAELTNLFKSRYGTRAGIEIAKRIITKCVINGSVIH